MTVYSCNYRRDTAHPYNYAIEKYNTPHGVADWWNNRPVRSGFDGIGDIVRRMMGQNILPGPPGSDRRLFGSAPPEVVMGFTTNSGGPTENTVILDPATLMRLHAERRPEVRCQRFHEIGLFGVPAGCWNRPAPSPVPTLPCPPRTNCSSGQHADNDWLTFHADPLVVALLGHNASMREDLWSLRYDEPAPPAGRGRHDGWEEQIAMGLVSLRKHGDEAQASLPPGARPVRGSLWDIFYCFMSWSAGAPATRDHLNYYSLQAPGGGPFTVGTYLVNLIHQTARTQRRYPPKSHTGNPAYSAIRTLQKIFAGKYLAVQSHAATSVIDWFSLGLGNDEYDVLDVIGCIAYTGNPPPRNFRIGVIA